MTQAQIKALSDAAEHFEKLGDLRLRTALAELLPRDLVIEGVGRIETWWDRLTRNWVTQVLDLNNLPVGNDLISGAPVDAAVARCWQVRKMIKFAGSDRRLTLSEWFEQAKVRA